MTSLLGRPSSRAVPMAFHGWPRLAFVPSAGDQGGVTTAVWDVLERGSADEVRAHLPLLRARANFIFEAQSWETFLYHAAAHNNVEAATVLVREAGAHPNVTKGQTSPERELNDLATPLHIATRNGHARMVHALIALGADVNARKLGGATSFYLACQEGQFDIVRFLAEDAMANIHMPIDDDGTPLYISCQNHHHHVVKYLLSIGADPHRPDNEGWLPIHIASQEGDVDIVRLLLDSGVPVDALLTKKDFAADNVWTPAGIAVHNKRVEVAKVLVDRGCNQQFTTCNGSLSLLHIAAVHNLGELLEYMLLHAAAKHGRCDVDLLAREHTAMAMAANRGHRDAVVVLSCFGAVRPTHGTSVHEDVRDWMAATEGLSGLQCCVLARRWQLARRLLAMGLGGDPHVVSPPLPRLALRIDPEPPCPETTLLAAVAHGSWSPRSHALYPPAFRQAVGVLFKCAYRLQQERRESHVPIEMWLVIASFMQRRHFSSPGASSQPPAAPAHEHLPA